MVNDSCKDSFKKFTDESALVCLPPSEDDNDEKEKQEVKNLAEPTAKRQRIAYHTFAEEIVPILREYEDTSRVIVKIRFTLVCDDFSSINVPRDDSVTFSNPLFKFDVNFNSSDINPLFDEVLEDIECKDSYDSNLDESTFQVTPLFDSNKDECLAPGTTLRFLLPMIFIQVSYCLTKAIYIQNKGPTSGIRANRGTLSKKNTRTTNKHSLSDLYKNCLTLANDEFSQHLSDDEASNHEDASDTSVAPKQQQQVIPQTTVISNIKSIILIDRRSYDLWAMEMEHYLEIHCDNVVWKVIQMKLREKNFQLERMVLFAYSTRTYEKIYGMADAKRNLRSHQNVVLALLLLLQPIFHKNKLLLVLLMKLFILSFPNNQRTGTCLHGRPEQIDDLTYKIKWLINCGSYAEMIAITMKKYRI
ncbi:hypothetical protein Tco_0630189 [Tanacetum coccineum]